MIFPILDMRKLCPVGQFDPLCDFVKWSFYWCTIMFTNTRGTKINSKTLISSLLQKTNKQKSNDLNRFI